MKLPEEPKKDRRIMRAFNVLFRVMAVVTFGAFTLLAGFDLGRGNESDAFANGIIALFWLGFMVLTHIEAIADTKWQETSRWFERTIEMLKSLSELEKLRSAQIAEEKASLIKELAEKRKEFETDMHDHEVFAAILRDMKLDGDKKPKARDIAKIQAMFHESTDRYVTLVPELDGEYIVTFSAEPIEVEEATPQPAPRVRKPRAPRKKPEAVIEQTEKTAEGQLPGQTKLPIEGDAAKLSDQTNKE